MKKIYLEIRNESTGTQIIDKWVAYRQSLNPNYQLDFIVSTDKSDADLKILFDYFFKNVCDQDLLDFDILLCCNGCESILVSSPKIKELLKNTRCYLICNSFGIENADIKDKLIWFPGNNMLCRDYWTRHFYPQPYENVKHSKIKRSSSIFFINGNNRAHRDYFVSILRDHIPNLDIKRTINPSVTKTQDSQWESAEDQEFREYVNSLCPDAPDFDEHENYYSNSVAIGIDNKFGLIPPGYFVLPIYYENSCVVFPESSWQNDELCITEKALKCFYAGSLPFPVGGANINKLYNDIGFFTAWNLLPDNLRRFDAIKNHRERYIKAVESIKWLYENPKIFESTDFVQLTATNFKNFLLCSADYESVKKFDKVIQNHLNTNQKI